MAIIKTMFRILGILVFILFVCMVVANKAKEIAANRFSDIRSGI
jgi:hypothetical protein